MGLQTGLARKQWISSVGQANFQFPRFRSKRRPKLHSNFAFLLSSRYTLPTRALHI
jgi:hypothetical protein